MRPMMPNPPRRPLTDPARKRLAQGLGRVPLALASVSPAQNRVRLRERRRRARAQTFLAESAACPAFPIPASKMATSSEAQATRIGHLGDSVLGRQQCRAGAGVGGWRFSRERRRMRSTRMLLKSRAVQRGRRRGERPRHTLSSIASRLLAEAAGRRAGWSSGERRWYSSEFERESFPRRVEQRPAGRFFLYASREAP